MNRRQSAPAAACGQGRACTGAALSVVFAVTRVA